jgi:hypothetical protein
VFSKKPPPVVGELHFAYMTYYFPFPSAIGDGNNTDLTSMVVMKEPRIKDVLTEDDHFIQVGMGLRRVP